MEEETANGSEVGMKEKKIVWMIARRQKVDEIEAESEMLTEDRKRTRRDCLWVYSPTP